MATSSQSEAAERHSSVDEEMKQSVSLGPYAHVMVRLNLDDGRSGITIFKKPFNSNDFTSMPLNVSEWEELDGQIVSLADSANEMAMNASAFSADEAKAAAGDVAPHAEPSYPSKLLSTRVMAKLNLFHAPNGQRYVTMAIRPYVVDVKTQALKLMRDGITLNLKEIVALKEKAPSITSIVREQMASTHFIKVATPRDVELAKIEIDQFFAKAITGQKMRLIIEKMDYPFHMDPNTISGAVAGNDALRRQLLTEAEGDMSSPSLNYPKDISLMSPEQYHEVLEANAEATATANAVRAAKAQLTIERRIAKERHAAAAVAVAAAAAAASATADRATAERAVASDHDAELDPAGSASTSSFSHSSDVNMEH